MVEEFSLTIIGCGSALPMHGRHPSAQVVQFDDLWFLIDCGEGTQERLRPAGIKAFRINTILISHLHGDHIYGLPGLMSSLTHLGRQDKLTIFGPEGIRHLLHTIIDTTEMKLSYHVDIVELQYGKSQRIFRNEQIEIGSFPLYHRIACHGYIFRELHPKMKFKKDQVEAARLTPEQIRDVQRGNQVCVDGQWMDPAHFTMENFFPVTYAYCSDTRFDPRLVNAVKDVKVIYHETTFAEDMADKALETGHSTSVDAGRVAREAGAKCLITGHFSSRYKDPSILRDQASKEFQPVLLAEEGKKYNLRQLADGACL